MDLTKLDDAELTRLQYEEEKRYAGLIRASRPFSAERGRITAEAYAAVARYVDERCARGGGIHAYGAKDQYISVIQSAFAYLRKKRNDGRKLVFYEAGIGTGYVIRNLAEDRELRIFGCDVYLTEELKERFPDLHEMTLYDSLLALPDDFVDVIYWNDVLEHIAPDETDTLLRLLRKKCRPDGLIITVTPSRYDGPHDITRMADPAASEPHGLHLKEYSLKEVLKLYRKNGWQTTGFIKGEKICFSGARLYCFCRCALEEIIHRKSIWNMLPKAVRRRYHFASRSVARPAANVRDGETEG